MLNRSIIKTDAYKENTVRIILDTLNEQWDYYIKQMPRADRDIYFTRQYHIACESNGEGRAQLFIYQEGSRLGLYPFMVNAIKEDSLSKTYYDIQTCYGYGGALCNTTDADFLIRFERDFINYCKENNVVCEFIRFHPLLQNHKIFKEDIDVLLNRETVYLDLEQDTQTIWESEISSKNRNMIRKAQKNNLSIESHTDLDIFKAIYQETMNKLSADKFYYFSNEYYKELKKVDLLMISIKKEDEVLAAALFMGYEDYFHYHLSGSKEGFLNLAPNNLLLWSAAKLAKEMGYKKFHFGGGTSSSEQDSLFKFKKSFSNGRGYFYIGKRIHNQEIYSHLIDKWEEKHKTKARLLLQYREQ
jgi:hypothetical protein